MGVRGLGSPNFEKSVETDKIEREVQIQVIQWFGTSMKALQSIDQ